MSDQEKNEQQKLHEEQVKLVRASLINSVFEKYHPLMDVIKKLPLGQMPGLQKAFLDIDTGMLWIKEILNTAPLTFQPLQKKAEEIKEENPIQELQEDNENQPENSTEQIVENNTIPHSNN